MKQQKRNSAWLFAFSDLAFLLLISHCRQPVFDALTTQGVEYLEHELEDRKADQADESGVEGGGDAGDRQVTVKCARIGKEVYRYTDDGAEKAERRHQVGDQGNRFEKLLLEIALSVLERRIPDVAIRRG